MPAQDKPFQEIDISLVGKLITGVDDGTKIDRNDFQILKNMRYGKKTPKSIRGMSKINSNVINSTYSKARSGYYFKYGLGSIPEIFNKSYLGFLPYHMVIDGGYIYVCGSQGYLSGGGHYNYAALRRIDLFTLEVVDQLNIEQAVKSVWNKFYQVQIDGDYIDLVGMVYRNSEKKAIVTRRNKSDFSEVWSNYYLDSPTLNEYDNHGAASVIDGDILYCVGGYAYSPSGSHGWQRKLNKSDGSLIWETIGISSNYLWVLNSLVDGYIDITGNAGGIRYFHRVDKVANTYTEYSYWDLEPLYYYTHDGFAILGSNYYVAGYTEDASHHFEVLVAKFDPSGVFTENWTWAKQYPHATTPISFYENLVVNSDAAYSIGSTHYAGATPHNRALLSRVDHDGNLIWDLEHEDENISADRAIAFESASILVVGTYDNDYGVDIEDRYGYIEKRSTATGAMLG